MVPNKKQSIKKDQARTLHKWLKPKPQSAPPVSYKQFSNIIENLPDIASQIQRDKVGDHTCTTLDECALWYYYEFYKPDSTIRKKYEYRLRSCPLAVRLKILQQSRKSSEHSKDIEIKVPKTIEPLDEGVLVTVKRAGRYIFPVSFTTFCRCVDSDRLLRSVVKRKVKNKNKRQQILADSAKCKEILKKSYHTFYIFPEKRDIYDTKFHPAPKLLKTKLLAAAKPLSSYFKASDESKDVEEFNSEEEDISSLNIRAEDKNMTKGDSKLKTFTEDLPRTVSSGVVQNDENIDVQTISPQETLKETQSLTSIVPYATFEKYVVNLFDIVWLLKMNDPEYCSLGFEDCAYAFYLAFYKTPEIRKKYPCKLGPCTNEMKERLMIVPDKAALQALQAKASKVYGVIYELQKNDDEFNDNEIAQDCVKRTDAEARSNTSEHHLCIDGKQMHEDLLMSNRELVQAEDVVLDFGRSGCFKFPVSLDNFKQLINYDEIILPIIRTIVKDELQVTRILQDSVQCQKKFARFYRTFYVMPEKRSTIPYKFKTNDSKLLERLLRFAEPLNNIAKRLFYANNKSNNSLRNPALAITNVEVVNNLPSSSLSGLSKVSDVRGGVLNGGEDQIQESHSATSVIEDYGINGRFRFPVSFDIFIRYINKNEIIRPLIMSITSDEFKIKRILKNPSDQMKILKRFYRTFYVKPEKRAQFPFRFKTVDESLLQKLMQYAEPLDEISRDIMSNVLEESTQSKRRADQLSNFPVSLKFFKKYIKNLPDIIKQMQLCEQYRDCTDEHCAETYYKAFYNDPEIRKKYAFEIKPAPAKVSTKLLSLPTSIEEEGDKLTEVANKSSITIENQRIWILHEGINYEFPVTFEEFKQYINYDQLKIELIMATAKSVEELDKVLHDEQECLRLLRQYYLSFYTSKDQRDKFHYNFNAASSSLQAKLLDCAIPSYQPVADQLQSQDIIHRNIIPGWDFNVKPPVSFHVFSKLLFLDDVVKQMKTDKQYAHMNSQDCKEFYYKAFYCMPEIRDKYTCKIRPCPNVLKTKLLQIPPPPVKCQSTSIKTTLDLCSSRKDTLLSMTKLNNTTYLSKHILDYIKFKVHCPQKCALTESYVLDFIARNLKANDISSIKHQQNSQSQQTDEQPETEQEPELKTLHYKCGEQKLQEPQEQQSLKSVGSKSVDDDGKSSTLADAAQEKRPQGTEKTAEKESSADAGKSSPLDMERQSTTARTNVAKKQHLQSTQQNLKAQSTADTKTKSVLETKQQSTTTMVNTAQKHQTLSTQQSSNTEKIVGAKKLLPLDTKQQSSTATACAVQKQQPQQRANKKSEAVAEKSTKPVSKTPIADAAQEQHRLQQSSAAPGAAEKTTTMTDAAEKQQPLDGKQQLSSVTAGVVQEQQPKQHGKKGSSAALKELLKQQIMDAILDAPQKQQLLDTKQQSSAATAGPVQGQQPQQCANKEVVTVAEKTRQEISKTAIAEASQDQQPQHTKQRSKEEGPVSVQKSFTLNTKEQSTTATSSTTILDDPMAKKAAELFFKESEKVQKIRNLICNCHGLKLAIWRMIGNLSVEEFKTYTNIYNGESFYKDSSLLQRCFNHVVTLGYWPENLYLKMKMFRKLLHLKAIQVSPFALDNISPKIFHWNELMVYTNFNEIVGNYSLRKNGAKISSMEVLHAEREQFYSMCWRYDKWIDRVPQILEDTLEMRESFESQFPSIDSNSTDIQLNDLHYANYSPSPTLSVHTQIETSNKRTETSDISEILSNIENAVPQIDVDLVMAHFVDMENVDAGSQILESQNDPLMKTLDMDFDGLDEYLVCVEDLIRKPKCVNTAQVKNEPIKFLSNLRFDYNSGTSEFTCHSISPEELIVDLVSDESVPCGEQLKCFDVRPDQCISNKRTLMDIQSLEMNKMEADETAKDPFKPTIAGSATTSMGTLSSLAIKDIQSEKTPEVESEKIIQSANYGVKATSAEPAPKILSVGKAIEPNDGSLDLHVPFNKQQKHSRKTKRPALTELPEKKPRLMVDNVPQLRHQFRPLPLNGMCSISTDLLQDVHISTVTPQLQQAQLERETPATITASQALGADDTLFESTQLQTALDTQFVNNRKVTNNEVTHNLVNSKADSSSKVLVEPAALNNNYIYRKVRRYQYFQSLAEEHIKKFEITCNAIGQTYQQAELEIVGRRCKVYVPVLRSLFPHCSLKMMDDVQNLLSDLGHFEYNTRINVCSQPSEDLRKRVLHAFMKTTSVFGHINLQFENESREWAVCKPIEMNNQALKKRKPSCSLSSAIKTEILERMKTLKALL